MNIISFDPMKLQKDVIAGQPTADLVNNVLDLVKNNFPGVTHIAVSVPMNSDLDFQQHNIKPFPLSVQDFTALWVDAIHKRGWHVIFRGTYCETEKIYNFPLVVQTSEYWVQKGIDFLNRFKDHIKGDDIFAGFPELEGHIWDGTSACIDNKTGNQAQDYNAFYEKMIASVNQWGTTNKIGVYPYITVNRSEAINGWIQEGVFSSMGAIVIDYYGESQTIEEMQAKTDELFHKYNAKYPIFQQEWGDTRPVDVSKNDPAFTASMADLCFFPKIKTGEMMGINFWNLFDTPQEGIVHIDGNSVSLNEKGQALAGVFKKWFGEQGVPITPQPTPTPTANPIPAFTAKGVVSIVSDGKGNVTMNISAK